MIAVYIAYPKWWPEEEVIRHALRDAPDRYEASTAKASYQGDERWVVLAEPKPQVEGVL